MANHVSTYVTFERISPEGVAKLKELYARIRPTTKERSYEWFGDLWVDGAEGSPTYEETDKYVWTTEHIGPKWCYFEEYGDDSFNTTSAWSYPQEGLEWLVQELGKVDSKLLVSVKYDDEGLNFAGCAVFDADGLYECNEWDYDEIVEEAVESNPELRELKSAADEDEEQEDEDVQQEFQDALQDVVYDVVYEMQHACITDWIQEFDEN